MARYYVNMDAQDNGDHEVHREGCGFMPEVKDSLGLGTFENCHGALYEARKYYAQANCCSRCCGECHKD